VALIRDTAITLRRLDYSESSQVLAVLTRFHGQQRLIAKGIKRGGKGRVPVGVDLLEMGEAVFSLRPGKEGSLATLTEWQQLDRFSHLRRDLTACYAAQYAADVTSALTEPHDPHAALFDGLRDLLTALDGAAGVSALSHLDAYLWRLLLEIGLRPELGRCMNCGQPTAAAREPLFFSSRQGGAVCRDCEPAMVEKRRMRPALAAAISSGEFGEPAAAKAAFELLDYHLTETLGRPSKLSRLMRDLVRG